MFGATILTFATGVKRKIKQSPFQQNPLKN